MPAGGSMASTRRCAKATTRVSLLVIIGVRADGTKAWVAIDDGLRSACESWRDVLRDRNARGLKDGPRLAIGDGASGLWAAPDPRRRRSAPTPCTGAAGSTCQGNVLAALPPPLQRKAKADLQASLAGRDGAGRPARLRALREPLPGQVPEGDGAVGERPRRLPRLLRLPGRALGAPAHDQPDRINLRDRTTRTKNGFSRSAFLGLACKLAAEAGFAPGAVSALRKSWPSCSPVRAIPVPDNPRQEQRAAA
jgi:hypothetical protein